MRTFTYQALNEDEELRTGEIAAKNATAALQQLESQGLTVLLIRQVEGALAPESPQPRVRATSETAGEQLLRDRVAKLLEKRATLGPALAAFAEELPPGRARRDFNKLARQIQEGASVDELTEPPTLTNIWLPLIGSDSSIGAGHLQEMFAEAERDHANRTLVARSLAYPAILFCIALAIIVFLGVFIVPTFREIFDDFDLNLPRLTIFIVNFSYMLVHRPLEFFAILVLVVLAIFGVLTVLRRWILPSRWLGTIIDGNSQQVTEMASYARRLAEALNTGVPLADALVIVGGNSKHRWLRRESLRIGDQLFAGHDSRDVFKDSALPATVNYALQAGPEGTPHIALLQSIADTYFERVRNRFRWATGFLPQVAVLCIGIVVAMVVMALYLPLVMLINGLSG